MPNMLEGNEIVIPVEPRSTLVQRIYVAAFEVQRQTSCLPCTSKMTSGIGEYPWTCANGHRLKFGGGRAATWGPGEEYDEVGG